MNFHHFGRALFALSTLFIALITTGCIGNPDQIAYCPGNSCAEDAQDKEPGDAGPDADDASRDEPDAADADDAGDSGDVGDTDTDADAHEPPQPWQPPPDTECLAATIDSIDSIHVEETDPLQLFSSIVEAYNAGCESLLIAPQAPVPLYPLDQQESGPLEITRPFHIYGPLDGTDELATIKAPLSGLFYVSSEQADLSLERLEIIVDNDTLPPDQDLKIDIIYIGEDVSFGAEHIIFNKLNAPQGSILHLKSSADLAHITIKDSTKSKDGLLRIDGPDTEITLKESTIHNNSGMKSAAITLVNKATLTIEESTIDENTIAKNLIQVFGAGVRCESSALNLDSTSIRQNAISPLLDDEVYDEEVLLHGAGLYLNSCDTLIQNSTFADNFIQPEFEPSLDAEFQDALSLEGAGIYQHSGHLDVHSTTIHDNRIVFSIDGETKLIWNRLQIKGAGVRIDSPTTASFMQTAIMENIISFTGEDPASASSGKPLILSGAGISISTNNAVPRLDSTTVAKNIIEIKPFADMVLTTTASGAGLAIFDHDSARLEMINSTISSNEIKGADKALGAGLFISSQGFEENSGNECSWRRPWNCILPAPDAPSTHLAAALRYSTIAFNGVKLLDGDTDDLSGGIYIENSNDADRGPILSLIGVLLQNPGSPDCGGQATIIKKDGESKRDDHQPNWGSIDNIYHSDSDAKCLNTFDRDQFSTEDYPFRHAAITLHDLDLDQPQTPVHFPKTNAVAGTETTCEGLRPDGPLELDQLGHDRPPNNDEFTSCLIGSIQQVE